MSDNYYGSGYDLVFGGGSTFWYTGYKYTAPDYLLVISKTENNGTSWTRHTLSSGTDYRYIRAIAVDPSDTERVFALAYEASAWKVSGQGQAPREERNWCVSRSRCTRLRTAQAHRA